MSETEEIIALKKTEFFRFSQYCERFLRILEVKLFIIKYCEKIKKFFVFTNYLKKILIARFC